MNKTMPRTPFSTALSGSAKETEIRLKNIFSGPKKRPPALFLALMFSLCIFCGNLVSCNVAQAEQNPPDASQQGNASPAESARELKTDLNRNGIPEEVRLVKHDEYIGNPWNIEFWENGERFLWKSPGVCLYTQDGKDYLLSYTLDEYQGSFHYYYRISDFSGEFEEDPVWNEVSFDTNFNALFHKGFDPEKIAGFMDELNGLLSHSVRLTNVDGELVIEDSLSEDLPWLDGHQDVFTRDPERSLLENLRAFQAAMPQDLAPPAPQTGTSLPISRPLEMTFSSGVGAWQTELILHPDGSFEGAYCDADMDIHYVCQFHGRFGNIAQLTGASWYMTLEELIPDTRYPVGAEWDEDGFHYISSEPYGMDGGDGTALEPGAGFIFYTPDAAGHAPGTELYGAYDFWTWWPGRHGFGSASDTLGCYGLHNLETGFGFFS